MKDLQDIVTDAIRQKRDLRFWHDAHRLTLSPYVLGLTRDGHTVVAGVTTNGDCMSVRQDDMIGIETVPRTGHPPVSWSAEGFETTLLAAS